MRIGGFGLSGMAAASESGGAGSGLVFDQVPPIVSNLDTSTFEFDLSPYIRGADDPFALYYEVEILQKPGREQEYWAWCNGPILIYSGVYSGIHTLRVSVYDLNKPDTSAHQDILLMADVGDASIMSDTSFEVWAGFSTRPGVGVLQGRVCVFEDDGFLDVLQPGWVRAIGAAAGGDGGNGVAGGSGGQGGTAGQIVDGEFYLAAGRYIVTIGKVDANGYGESTTLMRSGGDGYTIYLNGGGRGEDGVRGVGVGGMWQANEGDAYPDYYGFYEDAVMQNWLAFGLFVMVPDPGQWGYDGMPKPLFLGFGGRPGIGVGELDYLPSTHPQATEGRGGIDEPGYLTFPAGDAAPMSGSGGGGGGASDTVGHPGGKGGSGFLMIISKSLF
ncbi:MAG: hypothetical protein FJX25_09875 [Alphaproteobacteria bacterium]|nr:hypothetical protein [Alphaproteobacteria bacterium]